MWITISMLQKLDRHNRNNLLKKLKQIDGVRGRDRLRVTGISKCVIDRVRKGGPGTVSLSLRPLL